MAGLIRVLSKFSFDSCLPKTLKRKTKNKKKLPEMLKLQDGTDYCAHFQVKVIH